jgi:transposase
VEDLIERGAGLDVHKETVVATVISGNFGQRPTMETRTFGTMTPELLELSDWLSSYGCTHVAMESSGIYWKPVYNILESDFDIMVVNAKHIKNVPGRKTDVKDSEWIAQLLRKGLLKASFIPPKPIRELRDLTRYRKKLIHQRTAERNRIHKILEDANIKLGSVLSDIFGMSGSRILNAVLLGRSLSTEELEQMVHGRVKPKIPELIKAIQGKLSDHHRFMIRTILSHLEFLEACTAEIETKIESVLVAYNDDIERLDTIPGVDRDTAAIIVAELGTEVGKSFPSAQHVASWAGVCPGNNESAGKKKSTRTNKGDRALKTALCEAAKAVRKTKTYLGAKYWALTKRRGEKKATIAIAHKILMIAYHMLIKKDEYKDLGFDYLQNRSQERVERQLVNRLRFMGYAIEKKPIA